MAQVVQSDPRHAGVRDCLAEGARHIVGRIRLAVLAGEYVIARPLRRAPPQPLLDLALAVFTENCHCARIERHLAPATGLGDQDCERCRIEVDGQPAPTHDPLV
jgi:hypothetical protein